MKTKADILKSESAAEVFEWLKANGEDREVGAYFAALLKNRRTKRELTTTI